MNPHLAAAGLKVGYGQRTIINGLDLKLAPGKVTSIVGPNGCGKSTLLQSLSRLLRPAAGQVTLDGRAIADIPTKQLAQRLGLMPQTPISPDGITVSDLVGRGRTPHLRLFGRWGDADYAAVAGALAVTGSAALAQRPVDELSGGQRQRVWIAMALAQETDLLLLDEPTTYLDIRHQLDVLDLLANLNARRGTTVVMVLHDLALAARYSDELIAMRDGRIVAQGAPRDIVTPQLIRDVFDVDAHVIDDPDTGAPVIIPRTVRSAAAHSQQP